VKIEDKIYHAVPMSFALKNIQAMQTRKKIKITGIKRKIDLSLIPPKKYFIIFLMECSRK